MADEQPLPGRRVTLADVAKRAGVSTALASIVMRDAPGASAGRVGYGSWPWPKSSDTGRTSGHVHWLA